MNGDIERTEIYGLMFGGKDGPLVGAFPMRLEVETDGNTRTGRIVGWWSYVVLPYGTKFTNPSWPGPTFKD